MSIRIQSGAARGRYLKSPPRGAVVRPIAARIRKSLFDILRPRLAGAKFLDLYAGTGTVGLEALSNGVSRCLFVDSDRWVCRVIEENLTRAGFADRARVFKEDALKDLSWLRGENFDFVFQGPPYKDAEKRPLAFTVPTLNNIAKSQILGPDGIVVAQHFERESLEGLSPRWEMTRQKEYGDSKLSFFRLKAE